MWFSHFWTFYPQAFNDYYSSEHNRVLSLWREVVSVKRFFSELQSTTERDLYRVKNELDSSVRELVGTLSGFSINAFAQSGYGQSGAGFGQTGAGFGQAGAGFGQTEAGFGQTGPGICGQVCGGVCKVSALHFQYKLLKTYSKLGN